MSDGVPPKRVCVMNSGEGRIPVYERGFILLDSEGAEVMRLSLWQTGDNKTDAGDIKRHPQ